MRSFWKSKLGKLIIGGCGIQAGTVFTCGGIVIALAFCMVCASANALSIGLAQEMAQVPTSTPVVIAVSSSDEALSEDKELELLQQKIDLLSVKVESLKTNPPIAPLPTPPPPAPPPTPVALAQQSGVILRSGPGIHYTDLGRLKLGETVDIVGRNSDSTWWLVTTPDGLFAWVADTAVTTLYMNDSVPVVTIPALLVQSAALSSNPNPSAAPPTTMLPDTGVTKQSLSVSAPTDMTSQSRIFVQDTRGYQQLARHLLLPTVSESFSPHGDQIAITEKIKLYTITTDGSVSRILLEDSETINLVGGAVWSPNGEYIAFVADYMQYCGPCRTVGLARLSDGAVTYLEPPAGLGLDMPRWTQDGRVLVNTYPDEPHHGAVYVYDTLGQGEVATGVYLLSSSHDGQKWFPWQAGKTWQVDSTQPTSYYSD